MISGDVRQSPQAQARPILVVSRVQLSQVQRLRGWPGRRPAGTSR